MKMEPPESHQAGKLMTDGNDMTAAAAIFAGCDFFGGYPITPSTEIMQFLTREIWKYGGSVIQAEDEIAGVGCALGASFAGKKAMTATSGPGMSLKTEIIGLASIAELPLVIVNVQRGGPSTGLPTKSEQADLYQAVFSAHGDVVRPVLAPTTVADTFDTSSRRSTSPSSTRRPWSCCPTRNRAAQGGHAADRHEQVQARRAAASDRGGAAGLRPVPIHRERISPVSHPGVAGGAYSGPASSTTSTVTDGVGRSARQDEREAVQEVRAAAPAVRPDSRRG